MMQGAPRARFSGGGQKSNLKIGQHSPWATEGFHPGRFSVVHAHGSALNPPGGLPCPCRQPRGPIRGTVHRGRRPHPHAPASPSTRSSPQVPPGHPEGACAASPGRALGCLGTRLGGGILAAAEREPTCRAISADPGVEEGRGGLMVMDGWTMMPRSRVPCRTARVWNVPDLTT